MDKKKRMKQPDAAYFTAIWEGWSAGKLLSLILSVIVGRSTQSSSPCGEEYSVLWLKAFIMN